MEKDYMENIRTDINHLNHKITHLDDDEIQAAWKRLQENLKHMNQLLVTERMDRMKEREQVERVRKLVQGQWAAKEMCLMSQMEKLRADLKVKDWQMTQSTKMEELSREKVERLRDGEIPEKDRQMKGGAQKAINHEWIEKMRRAVEALEKEPPEDDKAQMKKRIKKLEEVNQQLQDELLMRDDAIERVKKKWKAEKKKVEKICEMSDELRSKNLEANARYKAVLKQKMEKLEREREMMRGPIDALEREIKESEDRILSAVPLMVMQKHRLMQELQKCVCQSPNENMSKKERQEWKKIQKKKEKELKSQKKAEEKRRKEQLKALKDTREKSTEKRIFWKRLLKRTENINYTRRKKRDLEHQAVTGYQLQSSDGEERVLSKDPQYSARVSVRTEQNDCDLTVRDVRLRDSGVYTFRFRTSGSDWISASSGVNLTVTELQVKVDRKTAGQRKVKVICSSTCSLDANPNYDWYRNDIYKAYTDEAFIVLDSTSSSDEGSYSCRVKDGSGVLGKECWGVTYTPERVYVLKGSSVDLSCSYKHPGGHTVTKSVWFIKEQAGAEPVDVREDEEYQGRVQYRQSSQNDCSMRITHLRERDAQTYRFRFYTDGGEYTGEPGITLSVTDLKVTVSDTDSGGKKLNCSSSCTLPNNLTYIWYNNGQPVIPCKSASCSVAVVSGAVSYSCAVEGHESLVSPPVYSPRNTRAVMVPSGERMEGDSVTLSCSSEANPPVLIYSWFKQRAAADAPLTTGQNYTITDISSQHSGLYYCTAHNQLGQHSSTPTHLDVLRCSSSQRDKKSSRREE
ncbi:hypothetical protein MHYP_G00300190 [Metynnis hypsauchen]